MIDKKQVMFDIERCICHVPDACKDCSKYKGIDGLRCMEELMVDAHTLLKEQEAVEPTFKQDNDGIFVWACGSCGAYMYHIYDGIDKAKEYAKYCRQCGRKVKWE